MTRRAGKFIIGLTGNIATGKSTVRHLLEKQGAYVIDADALSHRAIAKGSPGFQPVLNLFGRWVLGSDGEIDRRRVGRIVFNDPQALRQLESIIHPIVHQGIDWLISQTAQPVVAVEAIKLFESSLAGMCDAFWVVTVPPEVQLDRLMKKRGLSAEDARLRLDAQAPQQEKIDRADVVIDNSGTLEATARQVSEAWERLDPVGQAQGTAPHATPVAGSGEPLRIRRAQPADLPHLRGWIPSLQEDEQIHNLMNERAILLASQAEAACGALAWHTCDLVARATLLAAPPVEAAPPVLAALFAELEASAERYHCEAVLAAVSPEAAPEALWNRLGYQQTTLTQLDNPSWQQAGKDTQQNGQILYLKTLRPVRVLRPI